jgi:hypothetical protein
MRFRRTIGKLLIGAATFAAAMSVSTPTASALVDCNNIPSNVSAAVNYSNINGCLAAPAHTAKLASGTFGVTGGFNLVSSGYTITKSAGASSVPLIRLDASSQYLIQLGDSATVSNVNLQANGNLANTCCSAVVLVVGSNTLASGLTIDARTTPYSTLPKDVGVYFLCQFCSGNVATNNVIRNGNYGVIVNTESGQNGAVVSNSQITGIGCDSVTFRDGNKSGKIVGNTIWGNGAKCANGGIPGGGVYSLNNTGGFLVQNNIIHNNCGAGIDLDNVSGVQIIGNWSTSPGDPALGTNCKGGISVAIADMRNSSITGSNVFKNEGRSTNRMGLATFGDPNGFYRNTSSPAWSDLPFGGNTAVAFALVTRKGSMLTQGNTIDGNQFIANCSSPCVGAGFFTSRGTGYAPGGAWSGATTNYFTNNTVVGSNFGSRRGGGNWYAASTVCTAGSSPAPCNADDYQHNAPAGDWARNDIGYTLFA